ncbi:MAG TPA: hypothetical protein VG754_03600 [Verrucomicrobiae bacterium]|nr:hypothetical protein [Verrucomicrobiae bacterium]
MRGNLLVYWFSWVNTICWVVCFWWMHRISARQDAFMKALKDQGIRIERLSKVEHDMLKEVHPQVGEIKQAVTEVVQSTREQQETLPQTKPAR